MLKKRFTNSVLHFSTLVIVLLCAFSINATAQPFITVWKTDNVIGNVSIESAGNQVRISCTGAFNYTFTGVSGTGSGTGNGNTLITFPAAGIYTVSIAPAGAFELHINSYDARKLLRVEQWGNVSWGADMSNAFRDCRNLTITATGIPNFAATTNMSRMFWNCEALTTVPNMNSWNTAAVTNMSGMFLYATAFNQDIGNWQTGMVTNMSEMFLGASLFNQDISDWQTGAVTDMGQMFYGAAAFNQNIGEWQTAAVTNMAQMFLRASSFNQNIGEWQTGAVTNMGQMFYEATAFNQDISGWNTTRVTDMESMFNGATAFNQNLGAWSLNAIVNMANAFDNSALSCANYSLTLRGWALNTATRNNVPLGASNITYSPGPATAAARNTLQAKGWTITDAGVGTCSAALPVGFGNISAMLKNKQLSVLWSTAGETNNSHFEVALSKDGEHFVPVGTIISKAVGGYSDKLLQYEFTASQNTAMMLGWGLLGLGLGAGLLRHNRRKAFALSLLLAGAVVMWTGCSKSTDWVSTEVEVTLYVRMAQVDQDGTKTHSKAVRVVRE